MEYRYQITQLLKENRSWKEISQLVTLNEEELSSIASGRADYCSGEEPLYSVGTQLLCFENEEDYYFGKIKEILPKTGELYPEFRYSIKWDDGFMDICWEQQVMDFVESYSTHSWLR